jgi:hypothetical protein
MTMRVIELWNSKSSRCIGFETYYESFESHRIRKTVCVQTDRDNDLCTLSFLDANDDVLFSGKIRLCRAYVAQFGISVSYDNTIFYLPSWEKSLKGFSTDTFKDMVDFSYKRANYIVGREAPYFFVYSKGLFVGELISGNSKKVIDHSVFKSDILPIILRLNYDYLFFSIANTDLYIFNMKEDELFLSRETFSITRKSFCSHLNIIDTSHAEMIYYSQMGKKNVYVEIKRQIDLNALLANALPVNTTL